MIKNVSRYWLCQLGGWGFFLTISIFFYRTLAVRKLDNYYLLIFISAFAGIIISHLMRLTIKRFKLLEKSIQNQISYFLLVTIIYALILGVVDVAITRLVNFKNPNLSEISLLNEIVRNAVNDSFLLLIWNLIYFTYHYVESNRKQEINTLRLQSLVKELELKTIKSHINPHFIFNALNSIRALVDENPARARTAITELSNILRSSMQAEKLETVTLEKELSIVNDYLALEKMRFEERLDIYMDIDIKTLHQPVPPMMVQTLVENAIKHGISKQKNGGTVKVISHYKNNYHEITVQNSGQLNGSTNADGFGIRSTQDRLNLLYQGKAKFDICNINADIVESKITMPVVLNNN